MTRPDQHETRLNLEVLPGPTAVPTRSFAIGQFSLHSLFLVSILAAACMGLLRAVPPAGFAVSACSFIALIRTAIVAAREQRLGIHLRGENKLDIFLESFAMVIAFTPVIAFCLAFVFVCGFIPILLIVARIIQPPLSAIGISDSYAIAMLLAGLITAGVVAILFRQTWRHDRQHARCNLTKRQSDDG